MSSSTFYVRWEDISCYLLGLSSLLLWGSLVFFALSTCGTAGLVGPDGRVARAGTAGSDSLEFDLGTDGGWSGFGTVTSFAPVASSPQWGQNLQSFKMEAQLRWKRWEMLPYGLHSMKVPCWTDPGTATLRSKSSVVKYSKYWQGQVSFCYVRFKKKSSERLQNQTSEPVVTSLFASSWTTQQFIHVAPGNCKSTPWCSTTSALKSLLQSLRGVEGEDRDGEE